VDFAYYWKAVSRRRIVIAVTTAICGLIGLGLSLLATPKYEGVATLAVNQPKIDGQTTTSAASSFVYLVRNRQSAAETIAKYHLADPPLKLTAERFVTDVLAVSDIRNTNLLNVSVTLGSPQLAADVANDVVARAIVTSRRLIGEQAARARDVFGVQLQQQQQRLQAAQQKVIAFRLENHLNVLGDDVTALLGSGNAGGQTDLFTRLATASGRLAEADRQIAKLPPEKQEALAQLQLQYDLARAAYASAETQYESARLTVETRSADLQIIDPAVAPDRPASPRPVRDTAVALLVGLVGGTLAVLIAAAVRRNQ